MAIEQLYTAYSLTIARTTLASCPIARPVDSVSPSASVYSDLIDLEGLSYVPSIDV